MGLIGGRLADMLLNHFAPPGESPKTSSPIQTHTEESKNKEETLPFLYPYRLESFFGEDFCESVRNKVVLDFGCGSGRDVVEMALRGASQSIGLELREELFDKGRALAKQYGVEERCVFYKTCPTPADIVISVDAFEHFGQPEEILDLMAQSLKPGGSAWISFGPPWYNPKGGHLFSVFPWSHLVFTENALIRWRSRYRNDGATCFSETAGGLNQMSIKRFLRIVRDGPFDILAFEATPIRCVRWLHNRLTREFFTSVVRCHLRRQ